MDFGGKGKGKGEARTSGDTLHAATTGETTDSGLGDSLDIVTQDLAVAFCSAFPETFAAFTTWEGR